MKKIIVLAMMAITCITMHAQLYVGGSFAFSSTKVKDAGDAVNLLSISPEIGYDINSSWAVGTSLSWSSNLDNMNTFEVEPYLRATLAQAGSVKFFTDLAASFGSVKYDGFKSQSAWGVGLRPGIMADVSDKVSLVTTMYLLQYGSVGDTKVTSFGINQNVSLGLIYHF